MHSAKHRRVEPVGNGFDFEPNTRTSGMCADHSSSIEQIMPGHLIEMPFKTGIHFESEHGPRLQSIR